MGPHYSTERQERLPVQVPLLLQPLLCSPCPVSGKKPQSLVDLSVAASTLSPRAGSSCPELRLPCQGQMGKANRELCMAQVVHLALFLCPCSLRLQAPVLLTLSVMPRTTWCPYCQGSFGTGYSLLPWVFCLLTAPGRGPG